MPQTLYGLAVIVGLCGCAASSSHDTDEALDGAVSRADAAVAQSDGAVAQTDAAAGWPDGSYELVSIEGCPREPIAAGFALSPALMCDWSPTEPDRRICSSEGSVECVRAADCTAQPFGHCEAAISSQCNYPHDDATCTVGAECTALPDGVCVPPISTELFCDAQGDDCHPQEGFCHYLPLNQVCTADEECIAVPGGFCDREVWLTRCVYFGCEQDADCGASQRCACHTCVNAECDSDLDCGTGEQCRQENRCGWGPSGAFHCTTPGDECSSDGDCAEDAYCDFDGATARFACTTLRCEVP